MKSSSRPAFDPADTLLTTAEAAAFLRIGKSTLYELMGDGELPYFKVGGARRISLRDLQRFIERCRVGVELE